jgi:predicted RNA-binding Zn-ribbon protein involved in translation (DUF1610 family)
MTALDCTTCGVALNRNPRRAGTQCRTCVARMIGRDAESRAKRSAAMRAQLKAKGRARPGPSPCSQCGTLIAHNPQRKGTRCRLCCIVELAKSPDKRAKCSAAMRAKLADPVYRAKQTAAITAGIRNAIATRPELADAKREHGRRLAASRSGLNAIPAGSPARIRAAAKAAETKLAWCPDAYRAAYRNLMQKGGYAASEVRAIIEDQIVRDATKAVAATAALSAFERQMAAVRNGARLVRKVRLVRAAPDVLTASSLGGSS